MKHDEMPTKQLLSSDFDLMEENMRPIGGEWGYSNLTKKEAAKRVGKFSNISGELKDLISKRSAKQKELAEAEKSLPSFRARYEDWATLAQKTQAQGDIDTRNQAYQEWLTKKEGVDSLRNEIKELTGLINAKIKEESPEGQAIIAEAEAAKIAAESKGKSMRMLAVFGGLALLGGTVLYFVFRK